MNTKFKNISDKELDELFQGDYFEKVKLALENGLNPNQKFIGWPILFLGLKQDYKYAINFLKLLIDYKADVNCKSPEGTSPLWTAVSVGNIEAVNILLENGAIVDSDGDSPPLEVAILLNYVEIAKLLLKKGANIVRPSNLPPFWFLVQKNNSKEMGDLLAEYNNNHILH